MVFGEQEIREFRAAGLPGQAGDELAVAVGFAARWGSPELRASDSDALRRHVPRRARAWLTEALIAPNPCREPGDATPNERRSGEHSGLPKTEGRVPPCGDARRGDNSNASPFDGLPVMNDFSGEPNPAKPTTMPERPTKGAEIGARLRARTNKLSDTARESARLRGMQLIYCNGSRHKVHAPSR